MCLWQGQIVLILFPISWATIRKNVLKNTGHSGYDDWRLTNRLYNYEGLLGMMDFKSIKTPKYFDSSRGENLHVCLYMCRFLQQRIYTTKVAPFTRGQQRGSTLSWPSTAVEWIAEATKLTLNPLLLCFATTVECPEKLWSLSLRRHSKPHQRWPWITHCSWPWFWAGV